MIYRRPVAEVLAVSAVTEWDWWQCDPRGQFALVVHGWRESCATQWVGMLMDSEYSRPMKQWKIETNIGDLEWWSCRALNCAFLYEMNGINKEFV